MKDSTADRELLRQYLLGRLDDGTEAELKLSQEILLDEDLAEVADSVEEQLIEDYLEGTLPASDRKAAEEFLLQAPERQQKLRFMRLLETYFREFNGVTEDRLPTTAKPMKAFLRREKPSAFTWNRILVYGQAAALIILFIAGASYISKLRTRQTVLEGDLISERGRSERLSQQVSEPQAPSVQLVLAEELVRSGGVLRHVDINPAIQRISVEIALPDHPRASSYNVQVSSAHSNEPIWAARVLPLVSAEGYVRLTLELPAQGLQSGIYTLVVSPRTAPKSRPIRFGFEIRSEK
jgi:anti-sigma factor RsiW